MPSNFAYLALFLWPVVVFILFTKRPVNEALAWSIIAGYMLLPEITAFDLPVLPAWGKQLVPSLFAAIMCYTMLQMHKAHAAGPAVARAPAQRRDVQRTFSIDDFTVQRGRVLFWVLLLLLFGSPFITAITNREPVSEGFRFISGMRIYDSFSMNLDLLVSLLPFFLARRFMASPESHVTLLKVLALACLAYSLLALWEVRMSPRLNREIYGFFGHSWSQHVRYGGYRPILFLNHGIWVAILFTLGVLASAALWRDQLRHGSAGKWLLASLWLLGVLILCKSVGAIAIAFLLLPMLLFFGARMQLLSAALIAATVMTYPILRGADLVPTDRIHAFFSKIDTDRASTLQYRFNAEDLLLERANQKPLAGWGSWGRNRVSNDSGRDAAATDGYWVIVIGVYGWLGYIAQFGLLAAAPVLLAFNKSRLNLSPATVGLTVVLAAALIDLIPNATTSPVVWLLAGALMGRYQTAVAGAKALNPQAARAGTEPRRSSAAPQEVPAMKPEREAPRYPAHVRRPREG